MNKQESNQLQTLVVNILSRNPDMQPLMIKDHPTIKEFLKDYSVMERYQKVVYQYGKIKANQQATKLNLTSGSCSTNIAVTNFPIDDPYIITRSSGTGSITITSKNPKEVVGIISDTHEPFCLQGYREFVQNTFKKYGVTRVVHIGDEVDNYYMSYHEKNPNYLHAQGEMEKAMANMQLWYKAFPNVDVLVGNHSALPFRQATTAGIPKKFLRTYEEMWEAPTGWKWHEELVIDNVKYTHGIGCSGQNGAIDRAIRSRQSTVIGHIHAFAGVNYHASNNDLIFGLNVGCGIDAKAYAFEYGKDFNNKPIVGCGIVNYGVEALFIPMDLGTKYEWK